MSITMIHSQSQPRTVSPHECALLVGIPLDEQSFYEKYKRPRDGNFAQSVLDVPPLFAWSAYSVLAESFAEHLCEIERSGAKVFRTLTAETLSSALSYEVITIATQWKSAEFTPADLLDTEAVAQELREGDANLCVAQENENPESIVASLNQRLHQKLAPKVSGMGAETRRQLDLIHCRAELEEQLSAPFSGGASIEFSDGFHALRDVTPLFPETCDRVIDLTICNSLPLAEMIRTRCRQALCLAMSDITRPQVRLPLYIATLKLLKRRRMTYEDALQKILDRNS